LLVGENLHHFEDFSFALRDLFRAVLDEDEVVTSLDSRGLGAPKHASMSFIKQCRFNLIPTNVRLWHCREDDVRHYKEGESDETNDDYEPAAKARGTVKAKMVKKKQEGSEKRYHYFYWQRGMDHTTSICVT